MSAERDTAIVKRQGGTVTREEFSSKEIATTGETAGSVLAAQSRAMVEARFVMAMRHPRDWDNVRRKLLDACERPGFAGSKDPKADKWGAAWYKKPVGEGVEGFSIRFAEEAMRCMRNLEVQTMTIYDDDFKRLLTVVVTDLEDNNSFPTSIVIEKTVERRKVKEGDEVLRTRLNSYGETIHIMAANEDQVFQKQQSAISKAMRNGILRLLPGDIQAECRQRILEIRFGDAAKDPGKVRREVSDGFGKLNILPSALKQYLGHDLGEATPAELDELRNLFKAVKAGDANWHEVLAAVLAERGEGDDEGDDDEERAKQAKPTGTLAEQLKAKREAKGSATAPKAGPPATPAPSRESELETAEKEQAEIDAKHQAEADDPANSDNPDDEVATNGGGMVNEDAQRAMLDDLIVRARKAGKAAASKAKVQAAFKLKSFDNLTVDQIGGAIDIIAAFLEE